MVQTFNECLILEFYITHEKTQPIILFLCVYNHIYFLFFSVDKVQNETLELQRITRSQMGSYLCIATNGHPPAVSKRVFLKVNCKFKWEIFILN